MRPYEDLVAEADTADVTGWGFGWLAGRATEERPPWGYARLLAGRLGTVRSALDVDTGGGEVVSEAPVLPPRTVVTAEQRRCRHPDDEAADASAAGLEVLDLRTARCRVELHDVGAVVWLLRTCPWWVPGFDVGRDGSVLRRLDARMRAGRPLVAHSTRHLIEARRPTR